MIWNTTPISASVADNLNSVITKILGKQSDTTTKENYKNASVTAKLNYLEDEMANLKTKVEVKGGVPRILDYGFFNTNDYSDAKSFTGPGRLVIYTTNGLLRYVVDGVTFDSNSCFYDGHVDTIPFQSSLIIRQRYGDPFCFDYILYEY